MDTINSFMFSPEYKVEILRDVSEICMVVTHFPTGVQRKVVMIITEDNILPFVRVTTECKGKYGTEEHIE